MSDAVKTLERHIGGDLVGGETLAVAIGEVLEENERLRADQRKRLSQCANCGRYLQTGCVVSIAGARFCAECGLKR